MIKYLGKVSAAVLLASGPLLASVGDAQGAGKQYTVVMANMRFSGIPDNAKVGDAIVWDNRDTVQHSATARDGSFDVRLQPGKTGRTVLKKAGTIAVDCLYHPTMRATLKVAPN
jgi:plastocyanin